VHVEGVLVDGTKVTAVSDRLVFTSDTLNDVASAFSKLTSGQTTADLGWMTKGIMGNNFDDTVFSLEPGVLSQPILDETNQYPNAEWLISVLEKSPDRAIDDNQKNNLAAANYSEWFQQRLQQGLASKQVIDNLSDSLKTWATKYMKDHPLK
jgi:parvulin-like peptidyl-prolyl isomerase